MTFPGLGLFGLTCKTLALKYHFHTENQLLSNIDPLPTRLMITATYGSPGTMVYPELTPIVCGLSILVKKTVWPATTFSYGASTRLKGRMVDLAFATNLGLTLFDPKQADGRTKTTESGDHGHPRH